MNRLLIPITYQHYFSEKKNTEEKIKMSSDACMISTLRDKPVFAVNLSVVKNGLIQLHVYFKNVFY